MTVLIFYLKEKMSIIFIIPAAILIYFIILFLLKAIKKQDFQSVKQSFGL